MCDHICVSMYVSVYVSRMCVSVTCVCACVCVLVVKVLNKCNICALLVGVLNDGTAIETAWNFLRKLFLKELPFVVTMSFLDSCPE